MNLATDSTDRYPIWSLFTDWLYRFFGEAAQDEKDWAGDQRCNERQSQGKWWLGSHNIKSIESLYFIKNFTA